MKVDHVLTNEQSKIAISILSKNFDEKYSQRFSVIRYKGKTYLALPNAICAVFLRIDNGLVEGDYMGVPYMVKQPDLSLFRPLCMNLGITNTHETYTLQSFDKSTTLSDGTEVYRAVIDEKHNEFTLVSEGDYTINKDRFNFLQNLIGNFAKVSVGTPLQPIVFRCANDDFAVLMPIHCRE